MSPMLGLPYVPREQLRGRPSRPGTSPSRRSASEMSRASWRARSPVATLCELGPPSLGTQVELPRLIAAVPDIDTTLAGGVTFPEGSALAQWLNLVGALTANQLPIWFARNNVKALAQPPSTEWIHLDASVSQAPSATQYFSVDTPVGGAVCGRVVYSDLHVSGGPGTNAPGVPPDYPTPAGQRGGRGGGGGMQGGIVPSQCAAHPLTPQEEALEFMLFDLSSCLVPIGQTPSLPPVVK